MIAHGIALAMMASPPGHRGLARPPAPPASEPTDFVAMYERMLADSEARLVESRKRLDDAEARAVASAVRLNAATCACHRAERAFADFRSNYPAWEADPGIAADGRRLRAEASNAGVMLNFAVQSAHMDSWIADIFRDSVEFSERHNASLRETLERHRRDADTRARPAIPPAKP